MSNKLFLIFRKSRKNVASMVMFILADINNSNHIKYINLSVYDVVVGSAPVASKVMHSSNKRGPSRHPGSIPGWGDPTFSNFSMFLQGGSK